jgi:O-methyltransferase
MNKILRNFAVNWRAYPNLGLPKRLSKAIMRTTGFDVVNTKTSGGPEVGDVSDLSKAEREIVNAVKPFTLTSTERIAALLNAVAYISSRSVEGNIVECGVWRGGSMMATALALLRQGDTKRELYLYDTFEGMPPPTEVDKLTDGKTAANLLAREKPGTGVWCYAGLEEVERNLISTGYPREKMHFIKGKVEETLPERLPGNIALLRLDTDWYESTKQELNYLFPLLDAKGVLILDDYGSWQGARAAVDEYFHEHKLKVYLHRIDATGRILVGKGI